MAEINFLQLRTLRIKSCVGAAPLLQATATLFTTKAQPKLEHLELGALTAIGSSMAEDRNTLLAVQALINSFAGLRILHLDVQYNYNITPQAIIRHARTLTSLSIGSSDTQDALHWVRLPLYEVYM